MATMFPALVRLELMLANSAAAAAAEAPARAAAAARSPYKNPLQQTSGMMIEDRPTTRNSPAKRPEQPPAPCDRNIHLCQYSSNVRDCDSR